MNHWGHGIGGVGVLTNKLSQQDAKFLHARVFARSLGLH